MLALKKHGARCQCCGASPATGAVINVDHIKPRKLFPELALDVENLQILCSECNHGKGNWDMTDWRPGKNYLDNVDNFTVILQNI
jgi:5-methylcytosine-specific restriction endonuclease McrA